LSSFQIGQRWISDMEPELGLGIVTEADSRTVRVSFRAAECERRYAVASAPLRRVHFRPGDAVKTRSGEPFTVDSVEERNGILFYSGGGRELTEDGLSDALSFTSPRDRLLAGFLDPAPSFDLRFRTLELYSEARRSPVRGFLGGRIDLIPHQIYVAHQVSSLPVPRVLLADEVGLGKTVEASLIMHRLLLAGRISRVLVLVPDALAHQWFVELLRKFNLVFRLVDEALCESFESAEPGANPFLKDPLCLCGTGFLAGNAMRGLQAADAEWDMVVVDEAHHLTEGSEAYETFLKLGLRAPGLMLLTATPEQLGRRGHFARLRLLDPDRHSDFDAFETEEKRLLETAGLAEALAAGGKPGEKVMRAWGINFPDAQFPGDSASRRGALADLLDRSGTGRVMFRNTRAVISGFPGREVRLIPLQSDAEASKRLAAEFLADADDRGENAAPDLTKDPRIDWLARMLKETKNEKTLLICRSADKARAVDEGLRSRLKIRTALFHEGLSLLQRDRNAAWFAQKDGARILVCSEIGSEGRNFQFAHRLVLFDLPLDPELLEQRIGRLDRIGQRETVRIDVPFVRDSPQETLVRWYHEGLDAFNKSVPGAYEIYKKQGRRVMELALKKNGLDAFLRETRSELAKMTRLMERGRDRLLELHSFNDEAAGGLIREIMNSDRDKRLRRFTETLLDPFGVRIEEGTDRTLQISFEALSDPAFPVPVLRDGNLTATFDRDTAVRREDVEFLTWDHPMITGAMELVLGSERGNASAALWPDSGSNEMLLEAVFVLECVAPPSLHADRFLPPTPVRAVVNQHLEDRREACTPDIMSGRLRGVPPAALLQNAGVKALIPRMIERCREVAQESVRGLIDSGLKEMETVVGGEIDRLQRLKKINPGVRDEEIRYFIKENELLNEAILSSRLRQDALRLIFKT
jgi:ATP-dependent helicase HepA